MGMRMTNSWWTCDLSLSQGNLGGVESGWGGAPWRRGPCGSHSWWCGSWGGGFWGALSAHSETKKNRFGINKRIESIGSQQAVFV